MPGVSPSDINVVSLENSTSSPISVSPNGFFNGTYVDVKDFTTITVSAAGTVPPASSDAIQIEWSHDGVTLFSLSLFGSDASTFQTVHATVRARYARVRYHASASGQTNLVVQTLLRKGTIAGNVSRIGLITGSPDAQNVNGVLFAKNQNGNFVAVQATNDPYLMVDPPPRRTTVFRIVTTANLSSVQVDFSGLGAPTRRWLSIFNNTVKGNMYIRLGSAVTLANFDYKIPPQHNFHLPLSWPIYGGTGGTVFGIWDVADGDCHMTEGA